MTPLRAALLRVLTTAWSRPVPEGWTSKVAGRELRAMWQAGLIWRTVHAEEDRLTARYCLPHDVDEMVIPNDHRRETSSNLQVAAAE